MRKPVNSCLKSMALRPRAMVTVLKKRNPSESRVDLNCAYLWNEIISSYARRVSKTPNKLLGLKDFFKIHFLNELWKFLGKVGGSILLGLFIYFFFFVTFS